jgi:hypothetical protein
VSDTPKDAPSEGIPHVVTTPMPDISPDDLARLLMATGMPASDLPPPPSKSAIRRKIIIAALIAGVGVGASVMSCVGQSFSLRQARAQEGIEQQLKEINARCLKAP